MKTLSMPARQAGVAALTAILVVAIATVLAVNLLWQTSVDLRRTETLLLQDQARAYDLGGEEFARELLARDIRENGPNANDTVQEWGQPVLFEIEGGKMEGFLADQQGRFNLNALVDVAGQADRTISDQYQRMLMLLPLESPLDSGTAAALTEATIDWIDPREDAEINGAEDDEYTSRIPPYRAANFWFVSTSELLAIKGYTPEIYAALEPHVTALPPVQGGWPINVNTASAVVLASLAPAQTLESVEPFLNGDYETDQDFRMEYGATIPQQIEIGVSSQWFLLTVTASIGSTQSTMYSLLERNGDAVRTRLRTFDAK